MALYQVTTAPTELPVTIQEAKRHLRIPQGVDTWDILISSLITAATTWAENYTQRRFVQATVRQWHDQFPSDQSPVMLQANIVTDDVTFEVNYWDADDVSTVLVKDTDYKVETIQEPGSIYLTPNTFWPTTKSGKRNAVRITYKAGYGAASAVPYELKQAILLIMASWYEQPSDFEMTVTTSAVRILDQYKIVFPCQ